jgi:hypothetical protein
VDAGLDAIAGLLQLCSGSRAPSGKRLAVVGLDRRDVLEPLGALDALDDLVDDIATVGGRLRLFAELELTGARG